MLRQHTFGEQAVRWEACHRKTNLKMGHLEGQRVKRRMSTLVPDYQIIAFCPPAKFKLSCRL